MGEGSLIDTETLISPDNFCACHVCLDIFQQIASVESMNILQEIAFFVVARMVSLILNGYLLFNRDQTIGKERHCLCNYIASSSLKTFKKINILKQKDSDYKRLKKHLS